jgi:hypothetical protein
MSIREIEKKTQEKKSRKAEKAEASVTRDSPLSRSGVSSIIKYTQ